MHAAFSRDPSESLTLVRLSFDSTKTDVLSRE